MGFNSPQHTLYLMQVMHGKYPDSGNERIAEGVSGLQTSLAGYQFLESQSQHQ